MWKDSAVLRSVRLFGLAWICGLILAALMVVLAIDKHLPVRDPDDTMLRFPGILFGVIAIDVVPRVVHRARLRRTWSRESLTALVREVLKERWPRRQWAFALTGLAAWYLCYATFRNVKSMVPFVNHHLYDDRLAEFDRTVWFGHVPAIELHHWLGEGFAAHVLSTVYIAWIALVPVSIAVALVWTRATSAGSWYVTAVAVDWFLGAVLYLLVPTLGPIYSDQATFATLPHTYVTTLEDGLWHDRVAVLAAPGSGVLQTIAAFPSLHVGMMVTICLTVQLIGLPRWMRIASWVFLVLTVCSTMYLGWHFFADILGGTAVGATSVWVAGMWTGNHVGLRLRLRRPLGGAHQGAQPGPADASGARPAPLG